MLRAHLILAFRKIFKNLSYSLIAISGLMVGLTTAILVFIWAQYELTYDRYDQSNERVYAVMINELVEGTIETYDETPVPLIEKFNHEISGVEAATRFDHTRAQVAFESTSVLKYGAYADTSYFKVFNPEIVSGGEKYALPDNQSIAISVTLAGLLFGDESPLGKIITIDLKNNYKVSAVFADYPVNSSLSDYSFILPFNARVRSEDEWQNYFVRLESTSAKESVERKIDAAIHTFMENKNSTALLFPLTQWRLHWNFENGKVSGGRIVYVVTFIVTAVFILLMACVNYINLATASAVRSAREIGVRKMTGASQRMLALQFLFESFVMTAIAMVFSLFIAYLLLPWFDQLSGSPLAMRFNDPILLAGIVSSLFLTALVAGSYPAFLMARLKPALILKGSVATTFTGSQIRKGLVIFQFTLSVILIFSALVMRKQTDFLRTKDLGFDKKNVINVWLSESDVPFQTFKLEVEQHSAIVAAGYGGASPMEINGSAEVKWPGKTGDGQVLINGVSADQHMLEALKFNFVQGRNFSGPSDSSSFVITESAARKLGFNDPIGQAITYTMFGEQEGKIIGVIRDFHNEDIHAPMDPVIFVMTSELYFSNLFVRYREGNLDAALAHVRKVYNKFQPGVSPDISFLDSDFQNQFFREKLIGNLSFWFTAIAVAIAGLGLLGLTMFTTQRRTKEIGVRKVLGATVSQIVVMLCRDFLGPVAISFLIAFPVSYLLMKKFLEGYAFRIELSILPFLMVALIMVVFVLFTVSFQSVKAARANPVQSLKS